MSIKDHPGVLGTKGDAAVDSDTTGTISGKLRGVVKLLVNLLSRWPAALGAGGGLKVDGSGTALPVSGTVTVNEPVTVDGTVAVTGTQTDALTDAELRAAAIDVDGSGVTQPVSAAALPLPSGAATSAKQDTAQTSLTAIAAPMPASLGQKAMSASFPVVLPSDQPVSVNVENALIPSASEYATDSEYTDGDVGGFIVGVRNEALRGFTTADDKFSPLAVDAQGRIFAHVQMSSEADTGLVLDGSAGTYVSTPDHADLDITGDLDIRVAVALNDWTPAIYVPLLAKSLGEAGYQLSVDASGTLSLSWNSLDADSTVAPSVGNGTGLLLRATLDVNNGAAGRDIKFYTKALALATVATDLAANTGWTQLGSTVTQAGTTSINANAEGVRVGADHVTPLTASGRFYGAVVKNGIDGTTVTNPTFSTQTPGTTSFADTAGTPKTWTLSGNAEITGSQTLGLSSTPAGALVVAQSSGYVGPHQVKVAHLDMTTATTTTIVSGVANKKIRVLGYLISCNEATSTDINFARGAGTTRVTGSTVQSFNARGQNTNVSAPPGSFLFETAAGENLRVTQTGATDISVSCQYIEVD